LRVLIRKLCPEKTGVLDSILNGIAFSGVIVLLGFIAVASKSSEFDASKTDVFIAFLLFGLAVTAIFVVAGLVCKTIGAKKDFPLETLFNKFCTALVLLFLIITVFWPETYGFFNGEEWEIDYNLPAVVKSLLPYCTALVIAVCAVLFLKKWFRYISPALCILICAIFVLSPVVLPEKVEVQKKDFNFLSKNQNIIFIIWDMLPGIAAEYILEQNPYLAENFRDFTFYSRAVTPYGQTNIAVPSILGGIPASRQFENNVEFQMAAEDSSILKKADIAGYWVEEYRSNSIDYQEQFFLSRPAFILYKCFLRVLPIYVTSFISDFVRESQLDSESQLIKKAMEALQPKVAHVLATPGLMANIGIGHEQPVFFFHHNLIPHAPWFVTRDGEFIKDATVLSDDEFSINLMSALVLRLKDLGIYDNSLIVFCSDHGLGLPGSLPDDSYLFREYNEFSRQVPEYYFNQGNSYLPVSRYNPFIMIKYPHVQQENLFVRDNPVSIFHLYQLFEQALNTPDWKAGTLTGAFDKIEGPIEARMVHTKDMNGDWRNMYVIRLMQTFELENGLESLPEIFNNLRPISETKQP
jgi:hypothetical protein